MRVTTKNSWNGTYVSAVRFARGRHAKQRGSEDPRVEVALHDSSFVVGDAPEGEL